jgi:hypothetical protein
VDQFPYRSVGDVLPRIILPLLGESPCHPPAFISLALNTNVWSLCVLVMSQQFHLLHTACLISPHFPVSIPKFWKLNTVSINRAIALMMEAASTSETSVNFYQTTRRYNPEYSHLWWVSGKTDFVQHGTPPLGSAQHVRLIIKVVCCPYVCFAGVCWYTQFVMSCVTIPQITAQLITIGEAEKPLNWWDGPDISRSWNSICAMHLSECGLSDNKKNRHHTNFFCR